MSKSTEVRQQTWAAPLAANATSMVSAHNLDGTTLTTVTAQPDFARNLQLVASGSTTSNVTITGKDILGNTVTETIALAGTTPVYTVHAFASVSSIVLPSVSSTTINIGIYTGLGLDSYCDENSFEDLANSAKRIHQQIWAAPAAASATAVHAAISTAAVITTAITNPDFPRIVSITGAGASHGATGNVVITGTDILGATITDTITLNSNTTVNGVKAFKTVTSIDTTGVTGIDASDTVEVGIAAALGLDSYCDAYSFAGFAGETSFTNSASVISQNTVVTSTAPNGSANIAVVYMPLQYPKSVGVASYAYDTAVISKNIVTLRDLLDGATDQAIVYLPSSFPEFGRAWG